MKHSTNHRDDKGRFMAGNPYAAYRGTRWQHFAHPGSIEAFRERRQAFDMPKTKPTEGGTA